MRGKKELSKLRAGYERASKAAFIIGVLILSVLLFIVRHIL
jgi:hypothetical protein